MLLPTWAKMLHDYTQVVRNYNIGTTIYVKYKYVKSSHFHKTFLSIDNRHYHRNADRKLKQSALITNTNSI